MIDASDGAYLNEGLLSLDRDADFVLGQDHIQVTTFENAGDGSSDVEVSNRLCPFVGELGLFRILAGLALLFLAFAFGQVRGGGVLIGIGRHDGHVREKSMIR